MSERAPRVCVVSEFYPRDDDPVIGIWAHRQAQAAQAAGAEVEVLVLHRLVPPLRTLQAGPRAAARATVALLAQPRRAERDGVPVTYVPFLAPPRWRSYGHWGAWAAPPLAVALRVLRKRFPFDLVHAHNAVPAGEAVRRSGLSKPLVVSVHGGDVFHTAPGSPEGAEAVRAAFARAHLVLANSAGIEASCRTLGARATRVLRLGTDLPAATAAHQGPPTIVTTAHLVARKRHGDVLRALWLLRELHPHLRYLIIGDGPERETLQRLVADLELGDRVELTGQLDHDGALVRMREASVFAMPSTEEAFGVAYVEAMAGGLPAIGALGEPGPLEIEAAGPGILLVPPGDVEALATCLHDLLVDDRRRREAGAAARETAERSFSWARCGRETAAVYRELAAS